MLLGHSSLSGARGRVAHDSWSWLGLARFFLDVHLHECSPSASFPHRVCGLGTDERTNM